MSQWIENQLRNYRDKVQKVWWIKIALTSIETRRNRGSIDSNLSRGVKKLSRCTKTVFQRKKNSFSKKKRTQTWMQSKKPSKKNPISDGKIMPSQILGKMWNICDQQEKLSQLCVVPITNTNNFEENFPSILFMRDD